MSNDETTFVDVCIVHKTDMAILVTQDPESEETNKAVWVPKSQIISPTDDLLEIGEDAEIEITVWMAEEKGLV